MLEVNCWVVEIRESVSGLFVLAFTILVGAGKDESVLVGGDGRARRFLKAQFDREAVEIAVASGEGLRHLIVREESDPEALLDGCCEWSLFVVLEFSAQVTRGINLTLVKHDVGGDCLNLVFHFFRARVLNSF